ncbi:MAG: hypothetical protein WBB67_12005 [bacterium]
MDLVDIYDLGVLFGELYNTLILKKKGARGDIYEPIYVTMTHIALKLEMYNIGYSVRHDISNWLSVLPKRRKYNEEEIANLPLECKEWSDYIHRELSNISILKLQTNGILNPARLLKGAQKFFQTEIWARLMPTAQEDLHDAAKSLLCGLATPSVMISLRAVEGVLRQYYLYKTKKDAGRKNWKAILDELLIENGEGNPKYSVNKTLLGLLDYIRENERNVAEHPDKRFKQDEAEGIFSEVIKTISEIYRDMPQQSMWDGTKGRNQDD